LNLNNGSTVVVVVVAPDRVGAPGSFGRTTTHRK
jgi:hypothetical protein